VTQITQWSTLIIGTLLAGFSAAGLGFHWAFIINALSFLFSAWAISRLRPSGKSFRAERKALTETQVVRPWHEYREGLRYMRSSPLVLGISLVGVGWATGGGAAQILFTLFGEQVFRRGPAGIGTIWGFAGIGLVVGGMVGHQVGKRVGFDGYKRAITFAYFVHGGAYVLFSQMEEYWAALLFIALSRGGVAVSSVLNYSQLLRHVADEYRGRVFSTTESMVWPTMMVSMALAGVASQHYSPRDIGLVAGILSASTGVFWAGANWRGWLPEPTETGVKPEEVEIHGEPTV
jgi:hypothetical protein